MTEFGQLLEGLRNDGDSFTIELPLDWLQGRTAYGGLSAALCLEATTRSFQSLPPLRSAHFSFVGPAVGVLRVKADIVRQGKSTVFTRAEIVGEMGVAAHASFCFGMSRAAEYSYLSVPMPAALEPENYPEYFIWDNRPNFMRHFEGKLVAGARPNTAAAQPEMTVWLRHRDQNVDGGLVALLALADALPPAVFVLFQEPVPISTVTWSVDFIDEAPVNAEGWWLVKSAAESACNGFSTQNITIWAPDGRPALSARQNVAVFGEPSLIEKWA
ncbi:thioesterase family protein [Allohahella marinimesophila]|uniref:Thioesterase family protein n=2 Tax=Allohahella marinimesophila TaxID=1054972 RepID=A0ABP7PW40_9GAMM